MSILKSSAVQGIAAIPYPVLAGHTVSTRFAMSIAKAPAVGDIAEIGALPFNCRIISMVVDSDKLDSNAQPAIAGTLGFLSGTPDDDDAGRDLTTALMPDLAVMKTGGIKSADTLAAFRTFPSAYARSIAIKFTAAATTFQPGEIGITVQYATA
jgi:hypothetical protein